MNLIRVIKSLWSQNPLVLNDYLRDGQAITRFYFQYAALEAGLLEALKTPATVAQLSEKLDVKRPEFLFGLLDLGVALGELAQDGELYRLKGRQSKALIGKNGPMYAGMVQAQTTYYNSIYRDAADRMHGAPSGNYLEDIGDVVARYSELVEPYMCGFVEELVTGKGPLRVLDVGCGSGIYLYTVAQANQEAQGIGLDLDENVVRLTGQKLIDRGIDHAFKVIHGDIRDSLTDVTGEFDLIGLYNNLYYFEVDKRIDLFKKLRSMLAPGGILAIVTAIQSGGKDLASANLNMATSSMIGCTPLPDVDVTLDQLKASGFNHVVAERLIPASTMVGIKAS